MVTTDTEYLTHAINCAESQGQAQLAAYYREQLTYRYDLAGDTPRVILITDLVGSRRAVPRLSYVVLPQS